VIDIHGNQLDRAEYFGVFISDKKRMKKGTISSFKVTNLLITKNIQKEIGKGKNSEEHSLKDELVSLDDLFDNLESKVLSTKEDNLKNNRKINILEHKNKTLQNRDTTLLETHNSIDIDNKALNTSYKTLRTQIKELKIARTKLEDEINQKVQLQISRLQKTFNKKFKGINQLLIRAENELKKEIDELKIE